MAPMCEIGEKRLRRAAVLFPVSMTPRLVAIAASGAIHAMVFASVAFTKPEKPETGPAAETIVVVETQEPPVEPVSNERLEAHRRPHQPQSAARDPSPRKAARVATPEPSTQEPMATDEGELLGTGATSTSRDGEGTVADGSETTYGEDDVTTPARLLSHVDAAYPIQAWTSGAEADVPVEIIVDSRGKVVSARVVTHAGHGFDDAALASIQSYRFTAAQRDGRAVRVRVRWSIQFRLRR
jgi:TonB family protein